MIISFECYCPTQWGQSVFITGSVNELGFMDMENALPMQNITADKWKVSIELDSHANNSFQYKYFINDQNAGSVFMEYGANRNFSVNSARFETIHVKDLWQYHGNDQYVWTKSAFSRVIFKRNADDIKPYKWPAKVENIVEFTVLAPRIGIDYYLGIAGNCDALGNWEENGVLPMNASEFPLWKIAIPEKGLPRLIEYKYVIVRKITGEITTWEDGGNRLAYFEQIPKKSLFQINDSLFKFPDNSLKKAGVSIPVFSIRTNESFGVGDFSDLKKVVNWAQKTKLKMIQVLPVNDTISTHGFLDSYPYKTISVFALHPLYLSIFSMGKLNSKKAMAEYAKLQTELSKYESVEYEMVLKLKLKYAKQLFAEKQAAVFESESYIRFFNNNKSWLEPYGAFCYLRDTMGTSDFTQWKSYEKYESQPVKLLFNKKSDTYTEMTFWYFVQYFLNEQLTDAGNYARNNGVVLKGDIPIGISRHSTDAWCEPHLFNFDGQAGAPPDDFSADGQNWGFPTYNWNEMEKDQYLWWSNRLKKMDEFFDAYRIDHILGFFRIWEIPFDAVQGILGHFRPSIPFSREELSHRGITVDYDRMCKPYIRGHFLHAIFGDYTHEVIFNHLTEIEFNIFELKSELKTQRLIYNYFIGEKEVEDLTEAEKTIMWGLIRLAAEVVLLPADELNEQFHPRISMHDTYSYKELNGNLKDKLNEIYIHYFYHRHEQFWKEQALKKLPALADATNMLICGEDLGMIPASVPEVMKKFGILSLEIQRMPKDPKKEFAHPADAPILSVCTTSTHDMSTIRGWWEENREKTQRFFNNQLGKYGEMPYYAEPWVCKDMILQHLYSPAMFTVFPIQDLLAIDEILRAVDTQSERINNPANPRNYWKYRMHLNMEELQNAKEFNILLSHLVKESHRDTEY